jgi:hypothetical protein
MLAQFLNGETGGVLNKKTALSARRRVLRLRDYLLRLQEQLDRIIDNPEDYVRAVATYSKRPDKIAPAWYCAWGSNKKVALQLRETNRLLARYAYRRNLPLIFPVTQGELPTIQAEVQADKTGREEALAVDMLLSLAGWSALDWVRQCLNCQRWFVKSRSDRQFCSDQCLQDHHVAQRDPKEQAAYMRDYRKKKKEREQRQEKLWIKQGAKRHAKS